MIIFRKSKKLLVALVVALVFTVVSLGISLSTSAAKFTNNDIETVRSVSEITKNNTLLVGDYAFELNDSSYTLNNYLIAAKTTYFNKTTSKHEIYYYAGNAWYDLVAADEKKIGLNDSVKVAANKVNGNGTFKYLNMKVGSDSQKLNTFLKTLDKSVTEDFSGANLNQASTISEVGSKVSALITTMFNTKDGITLKSFSGLSNPTESQAQAKVVELMKKLGTKLIDLNDRTLDISVTYGYKKTESTVSFSVKYNTSGLPILVSAISITPETLELTVGATETLESTVLPVDATNKKVTWTSSASDIATVDSNGTVKALAEGTATITAKAGEKTATAKVTVKLSDDAQAAVDANSFKTTHAAILEKTVETVVIEDGALVEAAIGAYGNLSSEAQDKLVDGEKALLDSLLVKIGELELAAELAAYVDGLEKTKEENFTGYDVTLYKDTLISKVSGTGAMADLVAGLPENVTVESIAGYTLVEDNNANMAGIKAALVALMEAANESDNTLGGLDGKSISYDVVFTKGAASQTATFTVTYATSELGLSDAGTLAAYVDGLEKTKEENFTGYDVTLYKDTLISKVSGTGAMADLVAGLPENVTVVSIAGYTLVEDNNANMAGIKAALVALMEAANESDNTLGGLDGKSISYDVVFTKGAASQTATFTVTYATSELGLSDAGTLAAYVDGLEKTKEENFTGYDVTLYKDTLISKVSGTGAMADLVAGLPENVTVVSIAGYTLVEDNNANMAGIKAALVALMEAANESDNTLGGLDGKSISYDVVFTKGAASQTATFTVTYATSELGLSDAGTLAAYVDGLEKTKEENFTGYDVTLYKDTLISKVSGTGAMADLVAGLPENVTVVSIAGYTLVEDNNANMAGIKAALVALMEAANESDNTLGGLDGKSISYDVVFTKGAASQTATFTVTYATSELGLSDAGTLAAYVDGLEKTKEENFTGYDVTLYKDTLISKVSGTGAMADLVAGLPENVTVVSIAGYTLVEDNNANMAGIKAALVALMEAANESDNTLGGLDGKSISYDVVFTKGAASQTATFTVTYATSELGLSDAGTLAAYVDGLEKTKEENFTGYDVTLYKDTLISKVSGTGAMADLVAGLPENVTVVSIAGYTLVEDNNANMAGIKAALVALMEAANESDNTLGGLDGKSISYDVVFTKGAASQTATFTVTYATSELGLSDA